MNISYKNIYKIIVCTLLCVFIPISQAYENCMEIPWKRKIPYNYYGKETNQYNDKIGGVLLDLVERYHFTSAVRSLKKGTTGYLPTDLYFVLQSIPNHPAALDTYSRYSRNYQQFQSFRNLTDNKEPRYSPDCFFKRAAKIYPNHYETYLVWGIHLVRNKKYKKAIDKYSTAIQLDPNSLESHYNIGLCYLKLGDVERAQHHADIVYSKNYPLPGLKNKIMELQTHE